MKISFTENNDELFEKEFKPIGTIYEEFGLYTSNWYLIFEENQKLYLLEFEQVDDEYTIVIITDKFYGPINVLNKTINLDNNAEYTFYIHDQSKVNIFGYFNKLSSNKEISKELFFKNTNFVESKVKWEQLFEKIKDSTYIPEDIEKILKL